MKSLASKLAGAVLALAITCAPLSAAHAQNRTATDAQGHALKVEGSVVLIEPDIELSLVSAGGLAEPRKEWSDAARNLYPQAVRELLAGSKAERRDDYDVPDDLDPNSQMGQIVRLNQAVALSISQYSLGGALATKKDAKTGKPRMDWSLGPGVAGLREATGADYALFTYIRDSYATGGRTAVRLLTMLAGAAVGAYIDVGGGSQVGVATLVDLRTGQVVWFNQMVKGSGDLRDEKGAKGTVASMLKGIPL
ncbi:hypothetical protein SAMN04487939_12820 [Lysobacter sp. yr284]|uniref:hypothetical protein n=1 Tax=Lysobacter sp. yr284 TaxID=1761791 RepID=UPI0008967198|nr:hypothetical protein [Lysobacter sp. yr284]SDZ26212.1 hypothetical protein SAMN04487939_12820 [Lysobacter sp. yr284]